MVGRAYQPERFWEERQHLDKARTHDSRSVYYMDRSRLIHSPAFRRLQAKTQVLDIKEGEYHRTRLTHSMEVAQIARGLVQHLNAFGDPAMREALPSEDLVETIAFAHDLGHPPFGHNGEVALNNKMQVSPADDTLKLGGFEGNGQSLRIVTKLERRPSGPGLNLTRRTLLGILKYPRPYSEVRRLELPAIKEGNTFVRQQDWKPPKCYLDTETDVVQWLLQPLGHNERAKFTSLRVLPESGQNGKTRYQSLDCSLLNLADDIAYATHDLEDGIALGLISRDEWEGVWNSTNPDWKTDLPEDLTASLFAEGWKRRDAVGSLIHAFIVSVKLKSENVFQSPVLDCQAYVTEATRQTLETLKKLTYNKIICSSPVQTLEYRGRMMIMQIFDALATEPESLLTEEFRALYGDGPQSPEHRYRVVCDFIAGMTDPYATRFYERLYVPRAGSTFDRL